MNRKRRVDLIYISILMLAFFYLLFFCQKGIFSPDESFYITIAKRLFEGDSLLLNEWHSSQLSGILLYPFYWIYRTVAGNNDGIILYFRYIYLLMSLLCSVFVFNRLRNKYGYLSILPSIIVFIYVPFNICTLSYNSIAYLSLTCLIIYIVTAKDSTIDYILSGVLLAVSVLCNPLLIVLFIVYIILVVINNKYKNINKYLPFFKKEHVKYFLTGIIMMIVYFCYILFSRLDVAVFLTNIKTIVTSIFNDPEHLTNEPLFREIVYLINSNSVSLIVLPIYILDNIYLALSKHKKVPYLISILCIAVYTVAFFTDGIIFINYFVIPITMMGLSSLLYIDNEDKTFYLISMFISIIFCLCLTRSSNQKIYCICNALAISLVIDTILIQRTLLKLKMQNMIICFTSLSIFLLLLSSLTYLRLNYNFWEKVLGNKLIQLTNGPGKGIYVNQNTYTKYEEISKLISDNIKVKNNVSVFSNDTYIYLFDNCLNGSYSGWPFGLNDIDFLINTYTNYYKVNINKVPRYIFIENDNDEIIENIYMHIESNVDTIIKGNVYSLIKIK